MWEQVQGMRPHASNPNVLPFEDSSAATVTATDDSASTPSSIVSLFKGMRGAPVALLSRSAMFVVPILPYSFTEIEIGGKIDRP